MYFSQHGKLINSLQRCDSIFAVDRHQYFRDSAASIFRVPTLTSDYCNLEDAYSYATVAVTILVRY
jgi:hypothetical protein